MCNLCISLSTPFLQIQSTETSLYGGWEERNGKLKHSWFYRIRTRPTLQRCKLPRKMRRICFSCLQYLSHLVPPVTSCREKHTHPRSYSLPATWLRLSLFTTASFSNSLGPRDTCRHLAPWSLQWPCKPRLIFRNDHTLTYIPSATPVASTTDRDPCDLMVPFQLLAAQTSIHTEGSLAPRKIKKGV